MVTGVSIGQIVLPLLLRVLLQAYGFPGTCLIFSGVVLNCCAASLLIYNVEDRPIILGDKLKMLQGRDNSDMMDMQLHGSCEELILKPKLNFDTLKEVLTRTWHHMLMMKHLKLLVVNLSFAFFVSGLANFIALVPFALSEAGYTLTQISSIVSLGAIPNTAMRVAVTICSDYSWFNRKIIYLLGSTLAAAASFGELVYIDNEHPTGPDTVNK